MPLEEEEKKQDTDTHTHTHTDPLGRYCMCRLTWIWTNRELPPSPQLDLTDEEEEEVLEV